MQELPVITGVVSHADFKCGRTESPNSMAGDSDKPILHDVQCYPIMFRPGPRRSLRLLST